MKRIMVMAALLLAFTASVMAQSPYFKNEVAVEFEAVRQQVEVRFPGSQDLTFNPNTDSFGGRFEYVRKVAPVLGIGMKTGVQFGGENRDGQVFQCGSGCTRTINGESVIALAHVSYLMRLQSSSNTKRFRPYVEGTLGFSRHHFDGISFGGGSAAVTHGNSYTYGGGAGFDIKFGKNVAWRFGADYLNTRGLEGRRHNVLLHTGPVIRFGSR